MGDGKRVFARPEGWDEMSPEQKREWALGLLRAATEKAEELKTQR